MPAPALVSTVKIHVPVTLTGVCAVSAIVASASVAATNNLFLMIPLSVVVQGFRLAVSSVGQA
jgi:hypothetical protein